MNRLEIVLTTSFHYTTEGGKKKSKSTKRLRGVANQPIQVIRNVVEPQHFAFEVPTVRVDQRPAYPQPCILALQRFCDPNLKSCYGCCREIFRSDTINYDDMVIVGNTERTIFDVQTQKYMVSPNSQNIYFYYHQQCILTKMLFYANNGWGSTRFKAFLFESKQISIDGISYSELYLSGNKIRETPKKHETGKHRKTWWYWFMYWFMFWFFR